jgi:hypothetical protein
MTRYTECENINLVADVIQVGEKWNSVVGINYLGRRYAIIYFTECVDKGRALELAKEALHEEYERIRQGFVLFAKTNASG